MKKTLIGGCKSCQMKNVQVQIFAVGLGHESCKSPLRLASGHTAYSFWKILSKSAEICPSPCPSPSPICPSPNGECPSPSPICPSPNSPRHFPAYLDLGGYLMEHDIELLWLPIDRVAALTDKSVKTVRRLAEGGSYVVLKRTVPSGKTHTTKSFVMADQELTNLEKAYCRRHRLKPVPMDKELMTVIETKYNSIFIVSYRKLREESHAG